MNDRLSRRMLFALVAGATAGVCAHRLWADAPALLAFLRYVAEPIGTIFLRLLFLLVIPLIVSALSLGVAGLSAFGGVRRVGRIGLKTLVYTVVVSAVAVLIGVLLVNAIRPGEHASPELRARLLALRATAASAAPASGSATAASAPSAVDFFINLVPNNAVKSMAEGDMLAVLTFSLLLGIGLALTRTDAARQLEDTLQGLYDVTMRLLGIVLAIAPIGVACLIFRVTARLGVDVLVDLGIYVVTVVLALALHQFGVYSLVVRFLGGMSPMAFFRAVRPAMVTAFSTASSNATLPTALAVAERNLKLPGDISRFVLTVGSTANQNGTALFEGVTVLFLAQLYNVPLSLMQQGTVVLVCILGGIGTAGVPSGSIPVVTMILGMVGVPLEGIGLILGVNHFLDMCRTTLNVTGDLAAAVVISRGYQPDSTTSEPSRTASSGPESLTTP